MAFKTKEQIFGDNGVNGLQVPISVSNPPGTAAANRGVGFGEGVTAAIANRAAYELAKNDEDVNARIADFETSGLDAAYRGGLSATPGSGRVVDIDGGAIEAAATGAVGDEANAVLRARLGVGGPPVGLDVVGDAYGAVLHRVPTALSNNTVLPLATAAVLNPAGAGVDIVEVTGPQMFAAAGLTDLIIGFDYLSIAGTANNDGLYAIGAILTDFRVQVFPLNGALPGFAPSLAAAVTLHRASARLENGTLLLGPALGGPGRAAFDTVADAAGTDAADYAFRASVAQTDGSTLPVFVVVKDGETRVVFDNTNRSAAELRELTAALNVTLQTTRGDTEASPSVVVQTPSVVSVDLNPPTGSTSFPQYVLTPFELEFTGPPPLNFIALPAVVDFLAATDGIEFQVPAAGVAVFVGGNAVVHLENTAGGVYDGYYHVTGFDTAAGNGQVYLARLNGTVPSFPVGTATLRSFSVDQYHAVGLPPHTVTYDVATAPHAEIFDANTTFDVAHLFVGDAQIAGGFVVYLHSVPTTAANRHGQRPVFAVDPVPGKVFAKNLRVSDNLDVNGTSDLADTVTLSGASNEVVYATARSRTIRIPSQSLQPAGANAISRTSTTTQLGTDDGSYFLDLTPYLPTGCVLQEVNASVKPGTAQATAADRVRLRVLTHTGTNTSTIIGSADSDATTNIQTVPVLALATTVNRATTAYMLEIEANTNATAGTDDDVYWITVVFDDIGPSNA